MTAPAHTTRRRSWLFVPGADEFAHERAARSGADVLIHELEDFTPPPLRERARALAPALYVRWRAAGAVVAVRVNPLSTCGRDDLAAVNRAFTPQSAEIARARRIVAAFEKARAGGRGRARVDGALIEVPIYPAAKRLLDLLDG